MTDPASAGFVQSLARGLAVIRAFDAEHAELSLSDVARLDESVSAAMLDTSRTAAEALSQRACAPALQSSWSVSL